MIIHSLYGQYINSSLNGKYEFVFNTLSLNIIFQFIESLPRYYTRFSMPFFFIASTYRYLCIWKSLCYSIEFVQTFFEIIFTNKFLASIMWSNVSFKLVEICEHLISQQTFICRNFILWTNINVVFWIKIIL